VATGSALLTIRDAHKGEALATARQLFNECAASLDISLCFQGFDEELASLPGPYAPPQGRLLLAWRDKVSVGCVALRSLEPGTCEMKRLYVRPAYRTGGVGRLLAERVIHEAATAGYRRMRLDSLPTMQTALQLYRRLGFREIAPYTTNPVKGAVFLELQLDRSPHDS
jgi:ribosomal protein S18 acetylase RimI-like enzyme